MGTGHGERMSKLSRESGVIYEEFVNKFYRGTLALHGCYDIENKKYLVEVKGAQLILWMPQNPKILKAYPNVGEDTTRIGRYHIDVQNHLDLRQLAEERGKIPRYVFVLGLGHRLVSNAVSWPHVDRLIKWHVEKKIAQVNLHIRKVWGTTLE